MPARRPRPDRALVVVPTLALVAEIIDRASIPRGALELDARSRPSSSAADRPWTSTSRAATRSIDSTIDCFTSTLISCTGRAPVEHRSSTDRAPIERRSSVDRAGAGAMVHTLDFDWPRRDDRAAPTPRRRVVPTSGASTARARDGRARSSRSRPTMSRDARGRAKSARG